MQIGTPISRASQPNLTQPVNPPTPRGGEGKKTHRKAKDESDHPLFAEFWAQYPRKDSRHESTKAFSKINPSPELLAEMLAGLARWKTSRQWSEDSGKYISHGSKWLNQKMWIDEPMQATTSAPAPKFKSREQQSTDYLMEQFESILPQQPGASP